MKYLLRHFPTLLITAFVVVLAALNFDRGTFLTGGDNLHPEFNFALNIRRSLFAAWQEYQGVGLLGGMGHAADLLRQLFLFPFSFIFPQELIRYFWAYLTLFLGALGAYHLIRTLLRSTDNGQEDHKINTSRLALVQTLKGHEGLALLGSLFYLLNLATIQSYYTPFEVFMAHFAALPWLLLTTYLYSRFPTPRHLLYLVVALFLSTPQGYVPTLFVVACIAMTVVAVFAQPVIKSTVWAKTTALRLLKLYGLIFVINAFWLLPFIYFTLTSASVNVNAKINQMATEMIFQQNREVGSITDVMLLKGFWLNNVEPNLNGVSTYMLLPWREHLSNPLILVVGYLFFAIILLGVIWALYRRSVTLLGLAILFLFSVIMLTTATPPFSWINTGLREFVPLFNQVFRFPFTKFSLLAGLTYAIFFAYGLHVGITFLTERFHHLKRISILPYGVFTLALLLLVGFSWPAFSGHLFYERETIALPKEYKDTFAFFAEQDKTTRIANLPQQTYWGWNFYSWGYSGSGFLWYGIKQPILDRAFDVWNPYSENYYFELSQALYAKDREDFLQVLQKYDVTWLLVDKNIMYPISPQSLFINEIEGMIEETPEITLARDFGNVEIYKVALPAPSKSFVKVGSGLPSVNAYTWSNDDTVYQTLGTYTTTETNPDYVYPFRSFFSQKTAREQEYTLQEEDTTLALTATLPSSSETRILNLPRMAETEIIVPATITTQRASGGAVLVSAVLRSPEVWLDDKRISGEEAQIRLFTITPGSTATLPLTLNNSGVVNIKITDETKTITTTFLSLKRDNIFTLTDSNDTVVDRFVLPVETLTTLPIYEQKALTLQPSNSPQRLKVFIPKITDNYANFTPSLAVKPSVSNCDYFRKGEFSVQAIQGETTPFLELAAKNATACISYYAPYLSHEYGYAIFLKHKNSAGRDLHFWLLNEDQGYSPLDTYVLGTPIEETTSLVVPPQDQFGNAYSLHFDSISIGDTFSHNSISHISVHPLPYTYLTRLSLSKADLSDKPQQQFAQPQNVRHPNESLYIVEGLPNTTHPATLMLSQSFDKAWKAYNVPNTNLLTQAFPFFAGEELQNHVSVNNWSNGWILSDQVTTPHDHIVIVYLPQYFEYLGFVLSLGTVLYFLGSWSLMHFRKRT